MRERHSADFFLHVDISQLYYEVKQIVTIFTTYIHQMKRVSLSQLLKLFCLTLSLLIRVSSILSSAPDLYIDRAILTSSPASYYLPNSTTYSFILGLRQPLSNISVNALMLDSFSTSSALISYTAEVQQNSQTNATLYFTPLGSNSMISSISFSILMVANQNSYFQLLSMSFVYSSVNCAWFNVSSSKFTFAPVSDYQGSVFIQWIKFEVILSMINVHEQFWIDWVLYPETSSIGIYVCSYNPNYVHVFKINLVLTNSKKHLPQVEILSFSSSFGSSSTTYYFSTTDFGSALTDHNCFFGLSLIHYYISTMLFSITVPTATTVAFTTNIYSVRLKMICLALCPSSTYFDAGANACVACSNSLTNCLNCSSGTQCTKCIDGYVVSPIRGTCIQCRTVMNYCQACTSIYRCTKCAVGYIATGGCATEIGCIEVSNYNSASGPSSFCTKCNQTQYILDPSTHSCLCKGGFKAGAYCSQIVGCIKTIMANNQIQCIYCDIQKHFHFDPSTKTCLCNDGFQLKGVNCSDLCGDGRVFTSACDDGNLIDGDGCSSSCTIELKYKCYTASILTPSTCQYVGKDLKIILIEAQKSEDFDNRGIFTFIFSPPIPSISKMNLSYYFNFSCKTANYQVDSWQYQNGKATLQVDYQTDLEGQLASASFSFDPLLVVSLPIVSSFTIKSDGIALIYQTSTHNYSLYGYFFLATAIVAIIILVFGSWFKQMVGVQLINVLQVIYYLHYAARPYTSASKVFQYLSILGLNILFVTKNQINVQFNSNSQRISFCLSKAETSLIVLSSILGLSAAVIILSAIFSKFAEGITLIRVQIFQQKFYRNVSLPLTMTLFIPAFLIGQNFFYSSEKHFSLPLVIISVLTLLISVTISLIFAESFLNLFKLHQKEQLIHSSLKINPYYVPVYQLYVFFELILMLLWLKLGVEVCSYLLMVLCILMVLWQIRVSPYSLTLDNVSIFMNIMLSIIFQALLFFKNKQVFSFGGETELVCYLCLYGLICLCQLLSIIRVIRAILDYCKTTERQDKIRQSKETARIKYELEYEKKKHQLFTEHKPIAQQHFIKYMEGRNRKDEEQNKQQIEREELKTLKRKMAKELKEKRAQKQRTMMEAEEHQMREELRAAVLKL